MDNTIQFINNLINGDFALGTYLKQISHHITIAHCDINILNNLHRFLNIETEIFVNDNGQRMEKITFGQLLLEMSKEHYHSRNGIKCKYHEESLLEHSVYAMLKCIEIMPITLSLEFRTRIAICALFHDIGKIKACLSIQKKTDGIVAFPFHGEYGCGIMLKMYVENPFFTEVEWYCMCRTINLHMCGYHSKEYDNRHTLYKMELLKHENSTIKDMLHWLCYGDKTGKVSPYVEKNVVILLKTFKEHVTPEANLGKFYRKQGFSGCLIKLIGQSGAGKSYLAKHLIDELKNNNVPEDMIIYIERDLYMCNLVMSEQGKPLFDEKPDATTYNECYAYYKEHKLQEKVNDIIRTTIKYNRSKIIIVDTLMNMYAGASQIYPECCNTMFKINIYVIRNYLIDESTCSRMNMSIEQQLELFGTVTPISWLPNEINLYNNTAITTNKEIHKHIMQPHMNFHYIRGKTCMGLEALNDIMFQVANIIGSNPDIMTFLEQFEDIEDIKNYMENSGTLCTYPPISLNTDLYKKCFLLKYLDRNKDFHKTWMRQVRGSVFLNVGNQYLCIKNLLQKGAEYVTPMHIKNGVTENETSNGSFDQNQLSIMKAFRDNSDLQCTLSFKSDGSLFGVILIPKSDDVTSLITPMLLNCPMSKLLLEQSEQYGFIPMFCSSGTLTVDPTKLGYYVTSILCGLQGFDYDELCAMSLSPLEVLEQYVITDFLERLNIFWCNSKFNNKIMNLSFEAVCKGRTSAWNDSHPELAVSYDHCSLKLLGATFNLGLSAGTYRAHYQLGDLPKISGFIEPLYWHCTHTSQVSSLVSCVSEVLHDRMTVDELYERKPYDNQNDNIMLNVDFEGFVIYAKINDNEISTGYEHDYDIDYGKAKTIEYYECHKMNIHNATKLNEYCENVSKHMPIVTNIKNFYDNIETFIKSIIDDVNIMLQLCCDKKHELYRYQLLLSGKRKMIESFDKMNNKITKYKMIMNGFEDFDIYYKGIVKTYIPVIDIDVKFWRLMLKNIDWNTLDVMPVLEDMELMDKMFNVMNK